MPNPLEKKAYLVDFTVESLVPNRFVSDDIKRLPWPEFRIVTRICADPGHVSEETSERFAKRLAELVGEVFG